MNNILKKNKIRVFIGFSCTLLVLGFSFLIISVLRGTFASEETFTRSKMQDLVVSTALSYYYNTNYSDYGQYTMDRLGDYNYDNDDIAESLKSNYYYFDTMYYRNLNITPEEVNRGNYYKIDCSGFAFNSYKNTFGYDASEYSSLNRYLLFHEQNSYKMQRVNTFSDPVKYHREAYQRFGRAWNMNFLEMVSNNISNSCKNGDCKEASKTGVLWDKTSNTNKKELIYQWNTDKYKSPKEIKDAWGKIKNRLLPGDIVRYKTNKGNGHVILYVGANDNLKYEKNFLHATGVLSGDAKFASINLNNKIYKYFTINNDNANTYIESRIDEINNHLDYLKTFSVLRPINTMCNDVVCKFSMNKNNVALTDTQIKNAKARLKFKDYRFEQFVSSYDSNGKIVNYINKNNSVNAGDMVKINLRVTNKTTKREGKHIKITAKVPDNTKYVSCTLNCDYNEKTRIVTWKDVRVISPGKYNTYAYTIVPLKDGKIENDGMTVTEILSDEKLLLDALKLGKVTFNVKMTLNQANSDLFMEEIVKFKKAVNNKKISYTTEAGEYKFDLDNLSKPVDVSPASFPRSLYYNAYGMDLGNLTAVNIKNAIFNKLTYPAVDNLKSKVNGSYPKYDATNAKKVNVFSKKNNTQVAQLTNQLYKNINTMLVPGMYGGRRVKGNETGDRIKNLRGFNNYGFNVMSSDFQVGDIIISFYSNSTYVNTKFVSGFDDKGVILTGLSSNLDIVNYTDKYLKNVKDSNGKIIVPAYYLNNANSKTTDDNKDFTRYSSTKKPSSQILNELFNQDLFVVLRPSRLYGTTIIKNYNYDDIWKSYVTYNTYKTLDVPKRDGSYTINYKCEPNCSSSVISNYAYNGWYTDASFTNRVYQTTELKSNDAHMIYTRWTKDVILPNPKLTGYKLEGWYSDSSLKTKVGNPGGNYRPKGTVTLYANVVPNTYEVTLNSVDANYKGTIKVYYQYNTTKTINNIKCYFYKDKALTTCADDGYGITKPSKTGNTFEGYYTSKDGNGTKYISTKGYFTNQLWKTAGDKTLYASFIPNTYEVTLNSGDASFKGTTKVYYQYNATKKINDVVCYFYKDETLTSCIDIGYKINKPTSVGKQFGGYFTGKSGSGTKYVNDKGNFVNQIWKTTGNKVLYASFVSDNVNIDSNIFDINDDYIILSFNYIDVNSFKAGLNIVNKDKYRIEIHDENNKVLSKVSTGSKTKVFLDNEVVSEYVNVVMGDVNETGTITMADVMKISAYLIDNDSMMERYNLKAADVDNSGIVKMNDLMRIVNYLLDRASL